MITAVVQFPMPEGVTREDARSLFESSAPRYREVAGLLRKYYLFDEQERVAGGCYLFESRAAADDAFDDDWRKLIEGRYGSRPQVHYFETPVVVDNVTGDIVVD
ncbi:MAG: YdhR family protein [Rhodovibrionaceae bacterium]|nr:YdhR family protein [Rhodovibrionaceae bacterium]